MRERGTLSPQNLSTCSKKEQWISIPWWGWWWQDYHISENSDEYYWVFAVLVEHPLKTLVATRKLKKSPIVIGPAGSASRRVRSRGCSRTRRSFLCERSSEARRVRPGAPASAGCERSVKIKLKIKNTYFENKSNTILKIKDLAAKIKWFSSKT